MPKTPPVLSPAPTPPHEADLLAQAAGAGASLVAPGQLFEGFMAQDALDALTEALARSRDARHPDADGYVALVEHLQGGLGGADVAGLLGRLEGVWSARMLCATEIAFRAGLEAGRARG